MNEIAYRARDVPRLTLEERIAGDERLARLVARGRTRAFAVLYERHHRALSRYCRSIVHDEQDAQDVLQTAMMRALAALQAGERELAVRPWLFRIVHNEAIPLLRRRRLDIEPLDEQEPSRFDVERTFEERERLATLVADLGTLGERQRAALVMRELSDLSIDEIAAVLSTSPGAAKQVLFEARRALHEIAEGRAMPCEEIQRTLSDRDGRMLRGRKVRAHLQACESCRAFQASIERRGVELRALAPPLPAAAAGALLARLFGHGGGHGGGGAAVGSTASLGGHATASLAVKAFAALAVAGVAGGTAQLADHLERRSGSAMATSAAAVRDDAAAGRGAPAGVRARLADPTTRSAPSLTGGTVPQAIAVAGPGAGGSAPGRATTPSTGSPRSPRAEGHDRGQGGTHGAPGGRSRSALRAQSPRGTPKGRSGHAPGSPPPPRHAPGADAGAHVPPSSPPPHAPSHGEGEPASGGGEPAPPRTGAAHAVPAAPHAPPTSH